MRRIGGGALRFERDHPLLVRRLLLPQPLQLGAGLRAKRGGGLLQLPRETLNRAARSRVLFVVC